MGVNCYYTGKTVNALVTEDGKAIYANGEWAEGWKDKKIRVAVSEYMGSTDRVDQETSMHNPFLAWSGTSRLVSDEKPVTQGAYEVLTAEGDANNGLLTIDTKAHYINKEFTGSVYAPDKAEAPRNH